MIAAIVIFGAGIALTIAKPGDLGGKETSQGASTTKPSTTATTAKPQSSASTSSASSGATTTTAGGATTTTAGGATTTTRPGSTTSTTRPGATTSTTAPTGGLNQGGAGGTGTGQHPVTGGTSMLALGFGLLAAALALRRSSTA